MKYPLHHLLRAGALLSMLSLFAATVMPLRADDLAAGRSLLLSASPLGGASITEDDVSGKPLIVTFFASWCPPCTDEFRALNQIQDRYGEAQLGIVAVNVFEAWGGSKNPARMQRFLARTGPRFAMVEGSAAVLAAFGDVTRIPTLIVFDRDGREAWRFVHEVDAVKMSATVADIEAALSGLGLE